jgi:hypothetical protein
VCVFQNLCSDRYNRLLWNGHQARAFIAGMWSSSLCSHWLRPANGTEDAIDTSQMWRRLSLPPLTNCCPRPKPLELAHLLSVSLVRLHDMVPDSHIIVHDLAVHAAGRQDVVVPCRRANSCLMHTSESSQLQRERHPPPAHPGVVRRAHPHAQQGPYPRRAGPVLLALRRLRALARGSDKNLSAIRGLLSPIEIFNQYIIIFCNIPLIPLNTQQRMKKVNKINNVKRETYM